MKFSKIFPAWDVISIMDDALHTIERKHLQKYLNYIKVKFILLSE